MIQRYAEEVLNDLGGSITRTKGDGWQLNSKDYLIRIMYHGGERADPYIKISHKKGGMNLSVGANGQYVNSPEDVHIPLGNDPINQIRGIINNHKKIQNGK